METPQPTPNQRLYRRERLSSTRAIGRLFADQTGAPSHAPASGPAAAEPAPTPKAAMAYPWRAVWLPAEEPVAFPRVLIVVPKRRLRHAVDRVAMRRRLREAYRRLRAEIVADGTAIDIAFIYVADRPTPYADTQRSLRKIFGRINPPAKDEPHP